MSQSNNIVELRRNKHLTLRERYTIEVLLKAGLRSLEIATKLGKTIEQLRGKFQKARSGFKTAI